MIFAVIACVVAFLAGGAVGEKDKFKISPMADGLVTGVVTDILYVLVQMAINGTEYLAAGATLFNVVVPFVLFAICGFLGWFVANLADSGILNGLGEP